MHPFIRILFTQLTGICIVMMTWILIALLAAGVIVWSVSSYRRIFADRHFAEVARIVAQVKAAALEHGAGEYRPADDPSRLRKYRPTLLSHERDQNFQRGISHSLEYGPVNFGFGTRL